MSLFQRGKPGFPLEFIPMKIGAGMTVSIASFLMSFSPFSKACLPAGRGDEGGLSPNKFCWNFPQPDHISDLLRNIESYRTFHRAKSAILANPVRKIQG